MKTLLKKNKNEVFVLCGPTGSGKTAFAINKALENDNIEIINCDAAQCYAPLKIGTGQPSFIERKSIQHHLFGFEKNPDSMTAFNLVEKIENCCNDILIRGKIPFIVGGSHFYIYCLFFKKHFSKKSYEKKIFFSYDFLEKLSNDQLYEIVFSYKNKIFIHRNDRYRLLKYAYILKNNIFLKPLFFSPKFSYTLLIKQFENESYKDTIKMRIFEMFKNGWLDEVQNLTENWIDFVIRKKIIGYSCILSEIQKASNKNINNLNFEILYNEIFNDTLDYVKKQNKFLKKLIRETSAKGIKHIYV